MKKQVIPALLLLMGMLSSLGVFLFAFPFWDAVLWMLYIPVLIFAVVVYKRLLLRRRKKVILILAGGMLLLGVLSFSLLQEGAHIAYNIITEVYHDASGYVFYPYDVTDTAMLYRLSLTWLLLYASIWLFCGMLTFWNTRRYFALFMLSFLPVFFTLLYQTPVPWLFAVSLIIFWFMLLLSRKGVTDGHGGYVRLSAFGLSVICVLLTFFTSLPDTYEMRSTSGSLRERLLQRVDELAYFLTHAGEDEGEVDLGKAANRYYTGATQLVVRSEDARGTIYLKSYSGALYEDNRWQSLPESSYAALKSYDWKDVDMWLDKKNPAFTQILQKTGALMHLEIEDHRASKRYALTPYLMKDALPETTPWYDAYRLEHDDTMRYTAYALSSTTINGDSTVKADAYPAFVKEHYLQIPANLKRLFDERKPFKKLTSLTGEHLTYDIQTTIQEYLRETTSYTLKPGRTPDDRDFVEFFLTENKKGYCVHYATTAVMLFRYMGIPARYAEGFSFQAGAMSGGSMEVPDESAHAWVEIFDSEKGWIPVEVTPGFESESKPSSQTTVQGQEQGGTTTAKTETPKEQTDRKTGNAAENQQIKKEQGDTPAGFAKAGLAALLIALPVLICVLQRRLRIAYRERQCLQRDAKKAINYSYRYLISFMKHESLPKTIRALCEKALYSPHAMTRQEAELVYGYAQKQAGKLLHSSPLRKRWKLLYLRAIG